MELIQKHELTKNNDSIVLKQKAGTSKFLATLNWKTSVDLDLHCMYELRDGSASTSPSAPAKKGLITKIIEFLFGSSASSSSTTNGEKGNISYSSMGSLNSKPFIKLDQDAGVGDTVGTDGFNKETMNFGNIDKIEHALIVANIYGKNTNFAQYRGNVTVSGGGHSFEVPLGSTQTGSWCAVALITRDANGESIIKNVNKTMSSKPKLQDFI